MQGATRSLPAGRQVPAELRGNVYIILPEIYFQSNEFLFLSIILYIYFSLPPWTVFGKINGIVQEGF
jgi:hypothetical protein